MHENQYKQWYCSSFQLNALLCNLRPSLSSFLRYFLALSIFRLYFRFLVILCYWLLAILKLIKDSDARLMLLHGNRHIHIYLSLCGRNDAGMSVCLYNTCIRVYTNGRVCGVHVRVCELCSAPKRNANWNNIENENRKWNWESERFFIWSDIKCIIMERMRPPPPLPFHPSHSIRLRFAHITRILPICVVVDFKSFLYKLNKQIIWNHCNLILQMEFGWTGWYEMPATITASKAAVAVMMTITKTTTPATTTKAMETTIWKHQCTRKKPFTKKNEHPIKMSENRIFASLTTLEISKHTLL